MNMMNHNESNCGKSGELMSYLYGEIRPDDSQRFERHIGSCESCAAEAASFASLRAAIGDWKSEFEELRTPIIDIPYPVREVASAPVSIFDSVRAFLSFPKLAAVSLALLFISAGFVFYLSGSDSGSLIAGGNQNRSKAVTSPTAQPASTNVEKSVEPKSPEIAITTQDPQPEKVSDRRSAPERATKSGPRKVAGNDKKSIKKQPPTLIDEADDEDKSLRLADLFDEIGTE